MALSYRRGFGAGAMGAPWGLGGARPGFIGGARAPLGPWPGIGVLPGWGGPLGGADGGRPFFIAFFWALVSLGFFARFFFGGGGGG